MIATNCLTLMKKSRPVNILLIEDNPGDVRLAQEAFKEGSLNVNLDVTMDGMEAISYLRKNAPYENSNTPDLVLLGPAVQNTDVLTYRDWLLQGIMQFESLESQAVGL